METSRRRLPGELVFALVLLVSSLAALWQAWRISGFSAWSSPGALPMFAALMMAVSAVVFTLHTARMPAPERVAGESPVRQFFRQITPRAIVWFTLLIVLYMIALEPAGFLLASFAFLVASMFALGSRRILFSVVVSAASLAAIYVVFQTVFSVVLPEGVIERVLK